MSGGSVLQRLETAAWAAEEVPERNPGMPTDIMALNSLIRGEGWSAPSWKTAVCTQTDRLHPSKSHFPRIYKHTKAGIQVPRSTLWAEQLPRSVCLEVCVKAINKPQQDQKLPTTPSKVWFNLLSFSPENLNNFFYHISSLLPLKLEM